MTSLIVRGGPLIFKGKFDIPRHGFYIATDGFDGWDDGTAIRRNAVAKAQAHGDFDIPGFLSARTLMMHGYCYAHSFGELAHMGKQLTGFLAQGDSSPIYVDNHGTTEWAIGRLAATSTFQKASGGFPLANWEMSLYFPNPRRFGPVNTPAAGVSVTSFHYGNFPATSTIVVAGSIPSGYTITGPLGRLYTVTQAVVAGHPHTIDMATGLLMVDGVYVSGVVSSGATWAVPPGVQVTQTLTPVSGTGMMTVSTPDTSI